MQVTAVDIIMEPLPESNNQNFYILIVRNYFTHWMAAFAILNQEATVTQKFVFLTWNF